MPTNMPHEESDSRSTPGKLPGTQQTLPGWINRIQILLSAACLFIASIALVVLVAVFGRLVFGRYDGGLLQRASRL